MTTWTEANEDGSTELSQHNATCKPAERIWCVGDKVEVQTAPAAWVPGVVTSTDFQGRADVRTPNRHLMSAHPDKIRPA